jgi:hypothetical protein
VLVHLYGWLARLVDYCLASCIFQIGLLTCEILFELIDVCLHGVLYLLYYTRGIVSSIQSVGSSFIESTKADLVEFKQSLTNETQEIIKEREENRAKREAEKAAAESQKEQEGKANSVNPPKGSGLLGSCSIIDL